MTDSRIASRTGLMASFLSRSRRPWLSLLAVVAIGTLAASCTTSSAPPSSVHVGANGSFLQRSGTGDMAFPSTTLPSKWTVNWTFDCKSPTKTGMFLLSTAKNGGSAVAVTNQTGLGGSGHKPFTKSGNYAFAVRTSCDWKVVVGATSRHPATAKPTSTTGPQTSAPPAT